MSTVGAVEYTYDLVEELAKLPDGWVLGQTAIVTDSQTGSTYSTAATIR